MHRSLSAKSSDPLAVDDEEPLDGEDGPKAAQWEHEDLAQVRVKVFRGQFTNQNHPCSSGFEPFRISAETRH